MDYKNVEYTLPFLPMRGACIFPGMTLVFDVVRPSTMEAVRHAMENGREIFIVSQKDMSVETPTATDIYNVGVVCRIKQSFRQNGSNTLKVSVEGKVRAEIKEVFTDDPCLYGEVVTLPDSSVPLDPTAMRILVRKAVSQFNEYVQMFEEVNPGIMRTKISENEAPGFVSFFIAQTMQIDAGRKQTVLEERDEEKRLRLVCELLEQEMEAMRIEREISEAAEEELNRTNREYYLREKMRQIQQELGEGEVDEIEELRQKILALKLEKSVEEKLLKELRSLSRQRYDSSEATVIRNYLETCLELPWNTRTEEILDIDRVRKKLDEDHFGLEKVKERIIEYLAVRKLAPDMKSSIICLVGPPGTGKTSIAMSIAAAINRKLVRISLGGVHDEAEVRGHRKTYVGAMPGRIIAGIRQAGSSNPLMVLDEIDKLGSDYRGDPSAALLEALDPEQNVSFRDNFLEVPYDLSDVFFITTANTLETVPRPLLDRMEVIELTSYTDEEKLNIAKDHLIPKQRKKHGLNGRTLRISDDAVREIISLYTRESGVRTLERQIAAICRKAAVALGEEGKKSVGIRAGGLKPYLGAPKYKPEHASLSDEVGLVRGLAWTSVGGEVLDVEVAVVDGTGKLELTGNLGDVMKESCHAAVTYIRSRAGMLNIDGNFYKDKDIHIHFPDAAVPKDGPSAGITICLAIISALTGRPVRHDIAMTGEISIRGRVLPIGGLKEKTMAAMRNGVTTVLVPADNEPDLAEIDPRVYAALNFILVDHMDKVIEAALIE